MPRKKAILIGSALILCLLLGCQGKAGVAQSERTLQKVLKSGELHV